LWGGARRKKGGMVVNEEVFMCFLMAMETGERGEVDRCLVVNSIIEPG
jgi:hypothetical protein